MALTSTTSSSYLVVFSLAALFLLIRSHAFEEQADWLRRRIGDPAAIAGLYLRGGTVFIARRRRRLAAPDRRSPRRRRWPGVWTDVGAQVIDWSRGLRAVPAAGGRPGSAPDVRSSSASDRSATWITNERGPDRPASSCRPTWTDVHTGGRAYDVRRHAPRMVDELAARRRPVEREAASRARRRPATRRAEAGTRVVHVHRPTDRGTARRRAVAGQPVDRGRDRAIDADPRRGRVLRGLRPASARSDAYTVTALIPVVGDADGRPDREPPAGRRDRVSRRDPRALRRTTRATALVGPALERSSTRSMPSPVAADNAYDLADGDRVVPAERAELHLRPDLIDDGLDCDGLSRSSASRPSSAASASTTPARWRCSCARQGYPARHRRGLPAGPAGRRSPARRDRPEHDAHAWVEVYFPGYGWVEFDPTGGGVGAARRRSRPGHVQASASPRSVGQRPIDPPARVRRRAGDDEPASAGHRAEQQRRRAAHRRRASCWRSSSGPSPSPPGGAGRAARSAPTAPTAWSPGWPRGSASGRGPNQTVYEYAGALGEVLPDARPELRRSPGPRSRSPTAAATSASDRLRVAARGAASAAARACCGSAVRRDGVAPRAGAGASGA